MAIWWEGGGFWLGTRVRREQRKLLRHTKNSEAIYYPIRDAVAKGGWLKAKNWTKIFVKNEETWQKSCRKKGSACSKRRKAKTIPIQFQGQNIKKDKKIA